MKKLLLFPLYFVAWWFGSILIVHITGKMIPLIGTMFLTLWFVFILSLGTYTILGILKGR